MKVAIVGCGGSCGAYLMEAAGIRWINRFDEVWAIGHMAMYIRHDRAFVLDDLTVMADAHPDFTDWLRTHDRPVVTSTVYPGFPTAVVYPLDAVVTCIDDDLLDNGGVMALAQAITEGATEISLYGLDFNWSGHSHEQGGEACAYLVGLARGRGVAVNITLPSPFMDARTVREIDGKARRQIYGYRLKQPPMGHLPPAKGIDGAP